jgi:hypothetical protein
MKVLIIGDSHVGKVMPAYKKRQDCGGFILDFVVAPGMVMWKFRFEAGNLHLDPDNGGWPDQKNRPEKDKRNFPEIYARTLEQFLAVAGSNPIDLTRYDAVVLCGGSMIRSDGAMRILGEGSAWWNDQHDKTRYSAALWANYVDLKLRKRLHCIWLEQLKDFMAHGGKVFSVPPPLYNELLFESEMENMAETETMHNMPQDANFLLVEPWYERVITSMGSEYIPIPKSLLSNDRRATDRKFKATNDTDYSHLNEAGGVLVLDAILNALEKWRSTLARA